MFSSPIEKQDYILTIEDLENFFRIMSKHSLNRKEKYASAFGIIKKLFLDYLSQLFLPKENAGAVKKLLVGQIARLIKENFFTADTEMTLTAAESILKDIKNEGVEAKKLFCDLPEEVDDFLSKLNDIFYQTLLEQPIEKVELPKMRTGLDIKSQDEFKGLEERYSLESEIIDHLRDALDYNETGLRYIKEQKMDEAIHQFNLAIDCFEVKMSEEMRSILSADETFQLWIIVKNNLACSLNHQSIELLLKKRFEEAIEASHIAINIFEQESNAAIKNKLNIDHQNLLLIIKRNLALFLGDYAENLLQNAQYQQANDSYRIAIGIYENESNDELKVKLLDDGGLKNLVALKYALAGSLNSHGLFYSSKQEYQKSIKFYLEAIRVYEQEANSVVKAALLKDYSQGLAYCLRNLVADWMKMMDSQIYEISYQEIIDSVNQAIKRLNQIPPHLINAQDKAAIASFKRYVIDGCLDIATVFFHRGQSQQAIEYYEKSFKLYDPADFPIELFNQQDKLRSDAIQHNLLLAYSVHASFFYKNHYFDKAIEIYQQAIERIGKVPNDKKLPNEADYLASFQFNLSFSLSSLALNFYRNKHFKQAVDYFRKARDCHDQISSGPYLKEKNQRMYYFSYNLAMALAQYAKICHANKQLENAIKAYKEAILLHECFPGDNDSARRLAFYQQQIAIIKEPVKHPLLLKNRAKLSDHDPLDKTRQHLTQMRGCYHNHASNCQMFWLLPPVPARPTPLQKTKNGLIMPRKF